MTASIRDEHRVLTAEFTAMTALTRAAGQTAAQAFAAALWALTMRETS